ncbi:MAG: nucleotidyltransferase domain-containing protein [Chloroflexota bacterium]
MEKEVVESKEIKESKELKEILVKHGVALAYLFGSHAKGTARASSDIDIAVLLPYDTPRSKFFDARLALTNELMDLLHKNEIDVVVLNEATPLLSHEILSAGKILYEDVATRPTLEFAVSVAKRYADTKKFRQMSLDSVRRTVQQIKSRQSLALGGRR